MEAPDIAHQLLLATVLGVGLALLLTGSAWRAHVKARRSAHERRAAGLRLMDCLKAYAAWMDYQREEPLAARTPDELTAPAPLLEASLIRDEWFPELTPPMVRLLQAHRQMIGYLWEQNILRLTVGGSARVHRDPRYLELRDLQDATLDALFQRCRQLIGDTNPEWHRTRSDFGFSMSVSRPSGA